MVPERPVDVSRAAAPELEMARPQTSGEEELQLQLAIAMSQEEAERERRRSRSDEVRLQMALKQSEQDVTLQQGASSRPPAERPSAMADLLSLDLGGGATSAPPAAAAPAAPAVVADPWGLPAPAPAPTKHQPAAAAVDPWGMPVQSTAAAPKQPAPQNDPWSAASTPAAAVDPWSPLENRASTPAGPPAAPAAPAVDPWTPLPSGAPAAALADPWSPASQPAAAAASPSGEEDEFAELTQRGATVGTTNGARGASSSPWDMTGLGATLTPSPVGGAPAVSKPAVSKAANPSPHSFLGENSALVNLDNLIGAPSGQPAPTSSAANPFGWTPSGGAAAANPFQAQNPPPPSINQMRDRRFEPTQPTNPWTPTASAANPFLS